MVIIVLLCILSIILNCILIYSTFNTIHKIEKYEEWISFFKNEIHTVYNKLKNVDDRNIFERDDDVGFVFSELIRIMREFNDRLK